MSDADARALKRERTAAQIERHRRVGREVFPVVVFNADPQQRCTAAAAFDGRFLEEPPMLPLTDCDRPRCFCAWRAVTRRELAQNTKPE